MLRRVGGTVDVPLDVRVLAATNRNVEQSIPEGRFREDLYYRLNVFSIELPTLDRRRDDIPLLVDHFIRELGPQMSKAIQGADNDCLQALKERRWPGNIRQLRNVIERALVVSRGPLLSVGDLPPETPATAGSGAIVRNSPRQQHRDGGKGSHPAHDRSYRWQQGARRRDFRDQSEDFV